MNNIIYNSCKRTILRGNYPEDMLVRLDVFLKAELINQEQYDELVALMEDDN